MHDLTAMEFIKGRKPAPRLDLSGAPDLEKIDDDEKEVSN